MTFCMRYIPILKYFRPGIPGPDSLSTLSTATELLQLLMPSTKLETPSKHEDTAEGTESSAMETGHKEEVIKMETDVGGEKVEEMNVDEEGKDSKDQQSKKGCHNTPPPEFVYKCSVTRLGRGGITYTAKCFLPSEIVDLSLTVNT